MLQVAFYLMSAITLLSGYMVVSARNPVHSVLFLILAFFSSAGLFVLMGAEFLAMLLVVVYVGAVAVLFLFVVMMLDFPTPTMRASFVPDWSKVGTSLFDAARYLVLFTVSFAVISWLGNYAFMEFAGRYYIAFNQDAFFQTIGLWQQLSTGQVFGAFALVIATTYCAQKLAFMMTGITFGRVSTQLSAIIPVGLIVAFLLAGEMFMLASIWGESPVATEMTSFPTPPLSVMPNTHALGQVLFTDYLYIFQTVGIILLVAMIGAIVLPQQRRPGTRKQSISDQVNRRREDAVELKKVKIGEGV